MKVMENDNISKTWSEDAREQELLVDENQPLHDSGSTLKGTFNGIDVAVKRIQLGPSPDDRQFLQKLIRLKNKNIVPYRYAVDKNSIRYITLSYVHRLSANTFFICNIFLVTS